VRFSDNFHHFLIFRKFWKFSIIFFCLIKRCMPASLFAPTGLCRSLVSAAPWLSRVLSSVPGLVRDGRSEPFHTEIGPCRARDRQRPHSSETQYIRNIPRESGSARHEVVEFWKYWKFSKNQEMLEIAQKAHKNKKIWKILPSNFFNFFLKKLILCDIQTISSIFWFFDNFEKF
jgi:hypothetical protein